MLFIFAQRSEVPLFDKIVVYTMTTDPSERLEFIHDTEYSKERKY